MALGVHQITEIYCEPNGHFPHNSEPLPENLVALSDAVKQNQADLGIAVDPDVDRLCFVCEDGQMFGEEYTLVAVADFVLKNTINRESTWLFSATMPPEVRAISRNYMETPKEVTVGKKNSGNVTGFGWETLEATTFDTTVDQTLDITAQWRTSHPNNSIQSQIFTLTQTY